MEGPSPFAGVVKELKVKVGDSLSEGGVVAVIEAAGDEEPPAKAGDEAAKAPAPAKPDAAKPEAAKPDTAQPEAQSTTRTAETAAEVEPVVVRSEEHTSELQSLIRTSYAVFCLKKNKPCLVSCFGRPIQHLNTINTPDSTTIIPSTGISIRHQPVT